MRQTCLHRRVSKSILGIEYTLIRKLRYLLLVRKTPTKRRRCHLLASPTDMFGSSSCSAFARPGCVCGLNFRLTSPHFRSQYTERDTRQGGGWAQFVAAHGTTAGFWLIPFTSM